MSSIAPPPALNRQSLLYRVLFLTSVGTLLPVLILGGMGWKGMSDLRGRLLDERGQLAENAARNVADVLHVELEDLLGVTVRPEAGEPGTEPLRQVYQRTRTLSGVFLLRTDGTTVFTEPGRGTSEDPDLLGKTPAVQKAMASGRSSITSLVEVARGERRLLVLVPLRDWKGTPVGLAGGLIDPQNHAFTALIRGFRVGKTGRAELVDENGTILASPDAGRVLATTQQLPQGTATEVADGTVTSAAAVPGIPWRVAIHQSESELLEPVLWLETGLLWVLPLLALVSVVLAWGAARSVRQPLAELTAAAERIAGGDLDQALPRLARDEVGRLGRSLERMRIALKDSLNQITTANEVLERRVDERTTELRELYRELKKREEARAKLLRKVIAAQEEERKRIARELHDETCQTVTALAVRIDTALTAPTVAEAREKLGDVRTLARTTLDDLHRLIFDLRPSVLDDLGLFPAIRWFADRHLVSRGISVRTEFEVGDDRLSPEVETALFRAVQESLTNIVRHAHAENVLIQAEVAGGKLTIEIEDDGNGFDPASVAVADGSGRGLGLLGIRERIELLQGTLNIESAPGDGTHVTIAIPAHDGGVDA